MVVGLGSGSTAAFAIEALARCHWQGLRFMGSPTSDRTAAQAAAAGMPLTGFGGHRQIDLTIDGADEVERGTLNVLKRSGGSSLREKIVATATPAPRHRGQPEQAGRLAEYACAGWFTGYSGLLVSPPKLRCKSTMRTIMAVDPKGTVASANRGVHRGSRHHASLMWHRLAVAGRVAPVEPA
jgi:hypothetical protein